MRLEFELNHLKYFYFTVLEGGVQRAADKLNVQQPVVSKMLKLLEEGFGKELLKKVGRKKEMTEFGQVVFRRCQAIFREIEDLESYRNKKQTLAGPFNFGCSESVVSPTLTQVVHGFACDFPELHPNLHTSTASHLLELISSGRLEFGLFFHTPQLPTHLEILHRVPTKFNLVVHKKHAKNTEVIGKFIGSREIDDKSSDRFPTVDRMRRKFPGVRIALSSNHLGFHKQLVLSGFGSSILPHYLVGEDLKKGQLVDLYPKENILFDLKIIAPKSLSLSPAGKEFVSRILALNKML